MPTEKERQDMRKAGVNGALMRDSETGQLYAIIGRCSNLFALL